VSSPIRTWLPSTPDDWTLVTARRVGPFLGAATYRRPDGLEVHWSSRGHRKGHPIRSIGPSRRPGRVRPHTWWIAGLFSAGSLCFALGSFPPYLDAVDELVDGVTLFVGSIGFTVASLLCFLEASGRFDSETSRALAPPGRPLVRLESAGWWSAIVQFAGTIWFNVMTLRAVVLPPSTPGVDRLVWRPDLLGSGCFLVASYLAWAEVRAEPTGVPGREVSRWVAVLNLLGSVAFGVSAVGAFTLPSTDDVVSFRLDNGGTFVGAICFLVAAVLLVPEARRMGSEG